MRMFAIFHLGFLFNCTIPLSLMEESRTVIYVHKVKTVVRDGKGYRIELRIAQDVNVILTLILATLDTDWIWLKMNIYDVDLVRLDLCLSGICEWCKVIHSIVKESFSC